MLFLLLFLLSIPNSISTPHYWFRDCPPSENTFAPNSKYHTNLNILLRSLLSHAAGTSSTSLGFYATSVGSNDKSDNSSAVYGLFLCRGDVNGSTCHDCVATATGYDLPILFCPNRKEATIWYEECMVRYSNESLVGKMVDSPYEKSTRNTDIPGNKTQFAQLLAETMSNLTVQAAAQSGKKFATKQVNVTMSETLYVLEQCTPDLTASDCERCLMLASQNLDDQRQHSIGSHVVFPSCNIRYETYPFYSGAVDFSLPPPSPITVDSTTSTNHRKKNILAEVVIAIVAAVAIFSAALLTLSICRYNKKAKDDHVVVVDDFTSVESLQYDLATLQSATSNYSEENKLGEGGFGVVYKGVLPNGQEIAVKRLCRSSGQGEHKFKTEVLFVAKLQHRNLVRLLGFCLVGVEKLLVYEYVPNKSLDYFIFDPEKRAQIDWGRRYQIIIGIARGMLYLHQDFRVTIIHCDLKASNILLDADMNPKIANFGMARIIMGVDQTQGRTSKVVGTCGYISPEYAMHGQFSIKSDVYSFGVLVLEIISGIDNNSFHELGHTEDFLSYAWKQWRDGTPLEFVDPMVRGSCSINEVIRCLHLGLLCVQESANERPTMERAILMLDTRTVTLPVPERPVFYVNSKSVPSSVNTVSVTEINPR